MPVYNGEKYIKETIESVLTQTFSDFEFIIIDDGSKDDTLNILNNFNDNRIKILKQNHGGIVKALNMGIKESQGEYIVRIDADDMCMINRFEILSKYMDDHKNTVVCGSWSEMINENGEVVDELKYAPIQDNDIRKYILLHNPFTHPSVIFRRSIFDKVGGYRKFTHNEDYELWTRMLMLGEGHNISEKLIKYRVHKKQITREGNLRMRIVGVWVRVLAGVRLFF